MKHSLIRFGIAVLGFYAVLWSALLLSPGGAASNAVAVLAILVGALIVRPGWNLRPGRPSRYWVVLFSLLLASAGVAAALLRFFKIPVPYDTATLNLLAVLPAVVAITGVEELLFRQIMFRWLEKQRLSGRAVVLATSVAFGFGHLGPVITQTTAEVPFYLLLSLYMLWVGALLGKIRSVTGSWLMSWAGHVAYNMAVLFFLVPGN